MLRRPRFSSPEVVDPESSSSSGADSLNISDVDDSASSSSLEDDEDE